LTLREAVSDVYYNQSDERIYHQGGAFVAVLLDQFGPEKFLELYTNCTRKTFERDMERIYGLTPEELDSLYWREIESHRASQRSWDKAAERCSPEEKALLEEFRAAYQRQVQDFDWMFANGTLEAVVRISVRTPTRDSNSRSDLLFQAREGRLMRFYEKSEGTRTETPEETGKTVELEHERVDCHLLTPDEVIHTVQSSWNENNEEDSSQQTWRNDVLPHDREYRQQSFRKFYLRAFRPLSLFATGYTHAFSNPDEYLWEPPVGTVIQSVVAEEIDEGDVVVLTLTTPDNRTLTLRLDRKRDWLLLEAKCRGTINDDTIEETDVREYGDPVDGMTILTKRTVSRHLQDSHSTEDMELVRFDPAPVDEAVFRENNLPLNVPKTKAARHISVEQRTRRHLMLAACWLIVPLMAILWPKRKSIQMKDEKYHGTT